MKTHHSHKLTTPFLVSQFLPSQPYFLPPPTHSPYFFTSKKTEEKKIFTPRHSYGGSIPHAETRVAFDPSCRNAVHNGLKEVLLKKKKKREAKLLSTTMETGKSRFLKVPTIISNLN